MNLVGKKGIFNAYDDTAWGELYAGKECTVLDYDDVLKKDGLIVIFNDGQRLAIQVDEFTELLN